MLKVEKFIFRLSYIYELAASIRTTVQTKPNERKKCVLL